MLRIHPESFLTWFFLHPTLCGDKRQQDLELRAWIVDSMLHLDFSICQQQGLRQVLLPLEPQFPLLFDVSHKMNTSECGCEDPTRI